jgi:hypothetical protein
MNMPLALNAVGDEQRGDHYYLQASAQCFYWGEYTPHENTKGKLSDFSPTNRLVSNLKKRMTRAREPDWKYKRQAIASCAAAFTAMWKKQGILVPDVTFIPMPPSRARGDQNYDPRILEILNLINRPQGLIDIRDCLAFDGRYAASHDTKNRPGPDELYSALQFDGNAGRQTVRPAAIVLFDDMLTSGAHFVAASRRLTEIFPGVLIQGHFIARRVLPSAADAFSDFDIL